MFTDPEAPWSLHLHSLSLQEDNTGRGKHDIYCYGFWWMTLMTKTGILHWNNCCLSHFLVQDWLWALLQRAPICKEGTLGRCCLCSHWPIPMCLVCFGSNGSVTRLNGLGLVLSWHSRWKSSDSLGQRWVRGSLGLRKWTSISFAWGWDSVSTVEISTQRSSSVFQTYSTSLASRGYVWNMGKEMAELCCMSFHEGALWLPSLID